METHTLANINPSPTSVETEAGTSHFTVPDNYQELCEAAGGAVFEADQCVTIGDENMSDPLNPFPHDECEGAVEEGSPECFPPVEKLEPVPMDCGPEGVQVGEGCVSKNPPVLVETPEPVVSSPKPVESVVSTPLPVESSPIQPSPVQSSPVQPSPYVVLPTQPSSTIAESPAYTPSIETLPNTGFENGDLMPVAGATLALGALLVAVSYKRLRS